MSVKDINKAIEQLIKEYKDSTLTYEKLIKIFPKTPNTATIKKILALLQLYNVKVLSSQEQAKLLNDEEAKKRREQREKLIEAEDDEFDLLKNKDLLEWSRSDSPVRMYLREMGQIPLLTKDEEVEISKKIEMGEDIILDAICYVPYLIDFILEYKEPLVNRERKVKELFKNFDDDNEEEEEEIEEIEDEEFEDEEFEDDEKRLSGAKQKKLDKRAQTIIEAFKNLEKQKKEWLKFQAKETAKSDDEVYMMTFNLNVAFRKILLKEALLDLGATS
jgi:RNA polymerase primary sigma factor